LSVEYASLCEIYIDVEEANRRIINVSKNLNCDFILGNIKKSIKNITLEELYQKNY
jgi:hypothetical protein